MDTERKKLVLNFGRLSKKQLQQMACQTLGVEMPPDKPLTEQEERESRFRTQRELRESMHDLEERQWKIRKRLEELQGGSSVRGLIGKLTGTDKERRHLEDETKHIADQLKYEKAKMKDLLEREEWEERRQQHERRETDERDAAERREFERHQRFMEEERRRNAGGAGPAPAMPRGSSSF